ncbi:MAG TPA: propionyl-CoA synthetase [Beijerinckia sp.]|nr:propionyl-CoA synthetase [Beijerinckia sp.]
MTRDDLKENPLHSIYRSSIEEPEIFWGAAAARLEWQKPFEHVLDSSKAPFYRWFTGGQLNICYNALDRHVAAGDGERTALIYDSPVTGTERSISYGELTEAVARFGGVLTQLGVTEGDRVIIYMPMVPEAVIAMLACARIGAVHSVVFGGFAANELVKRIDDAKPKVIVSASCGIEGSKLIPYKPLLDAALEISVAPPQHCVILQRPMLEASLTPGLDLDWQEALSSSEAVPCATTSATAPLYILYTSGTTGTPKGVVHDHGGYAVALHWSMSNIYNVSPGEVFWAASDIGWAVGHSYSVYAPLLQGATSLLYEGKPVGTPDAGAFWRVIRQHGVKVLLTAPTALRAIRQHDPEGTFIASAPLGGFRNLFLAGERCDPSTLAWAEAQLKVPVIDHWWQTETGWPIAANCLGIGQVPVKPGSVGHAVPGWRVEALDLEQNKVAAGEIGNLAIKLPLPPGSLPTLWQADDRFVDSYLREFPGYYQTGDAGLIDEDGYIFVMARTDDVINVAAHRLSTGGMEEVVAEHPAVAECAVIGIADELRGQIPVGLVVLKANCTLEHRQIEAEIIDLVRNRIGAVACFKNLIIVGRLPKTRSGKILRKSMRAIAEGQKIEIPSTIDDPAILDEITFAMRAAGLATSQ